MVKFPTIMHGVHGLIGRGEAAYLHQIGSQLGEGIYIDLGTFRGRSAVCIADSFRLAKLDDAQVWTIDTFDRRGLSARWQKDNKERGPGKPPGTPEAKRIAEVQEVMESRGLTDYVRIISSETTEIPEDLGSNKVRFVFIDADHSYRGCSKDWVTWKDRVAPDGHIAFHDSNLPGVAKTHELWMKGWEQIHSVESITVWARV